LEGLSSYSSETAPRLTVADLSALLAEETLAMHG